MCTRLFCSALIFGFILLLPFDASSQWLQTKGPYGGNILSMAASGSTLFAGTNQGGVFRSSDNGSSWQQIGLAGYSTIPSLYVNGPNVYAVSIHDYYKGPVYAYSGTGTSWSEVAWNLPQGTLFTFVKKIGSIMFAATTPGLYRSTDDGAHWTAADSGMGDARIFVDDIAAAGKYLFAATIDGVFRSTDGGAIWSASSASLGVLSVHRLAVMDTVIFAAGDSYCGMYRSSDYGETWTQYRKGLENASMIHSLVVVDTTLFAGADGGVFLSTDKGETWTRRSDGMTNSCVSVLIATVTGFFAGTSGGVFYSADKGMSWTPSSAGMTNTSITTLWANDSVIVAGLHPFGVMRSADEGESWSPVGPAQACALAFVRCGTDLFMAAENGLFHSPDRGMSWVRVDTLIKGYALAASDSLLVVGAADSIWISADHGKTWTASILGVTRTNIQAVAVIDGTIFAGADHGLFLSADGGAHWEKITSLTGIEALVVRGTDLFADCFLAGVCRIIKSEGGAWTSSSLGLSDVSSFAVVNAKLFAGRRLDVLGCPPDGLRWNWMSPQLEMVLTSMSASERYLYAGTQGGGIYKLSISDVLSVDGDEGADVPAGFSLGRNYPNPFNPSTTISFTVPARMFVRLTVFDVMGREIARMVDGELPAGVHECRWNAAGRASGVYYYRLQAGERVETRTMMMVK
jgi:photosystem II stability/assembly factor-like uncharacterized protein